MLTSKALNPKPTPSEPGLLPALSESLETLWKLCVFSNQNLNTSCASLSHCWWSGFPTQRDGRAAARQVGSACHLFSSGDGWQGWNDWTGRNLGPLPYLQSYCFRSFTFMEHFRTPLRKLQGLCCGTLLGMQAQMKPLEDGCCPR